MAEAPHLPGERAHVDRLLEVAVEALREQPLAIALHRERGQRDDRNRGSSRIALERDHGVRPIHVRQPDVHQDHVREACTGDGDALGAVPRLERLEPRDAQDVTGEPHVLLVVVDDQDGDGGHRVTPPAGGEA